MGIIPGLTNESTHASELYPSIAAVASVYGDPGGTYNYFLSQHDPDYAAEPYFLWNRQVGKTISTSLPSINQDARIHISPGVALVTLSLLVRAMVDDTLFFSFLVLDSMEKTY